MIKQTFLNLPKEKYEYIIETSHQLFNEIGFDNLTIKDVVTKTGISRGSFYQYFDELYDVFYACILDTVQKKMTTMNPVMEKIGTIPFLKLYKEMIYEGINFAKNHPIEVNTSLILYQSSHPLIKRLLKEVETEGVKMFESYIKIDQSQGYIDPLIDPKMLARVLYLFNAHELLNRFKEGLSTEELIEYAYGFLKMIKTGIN
jgi:AcrR family transcriptional regulator